MEKGLYRKKITHCMKKKLSGKRLFKRKNYTEKRLDGEGLYRKKITLYKGGTTEKKNYKEMRLYFTKRELYNEKTIRREII